MSELNINFDEGRVAFQPGEELRGTVNWSAESAPHDLELRLFWFTRGKGIEDVCIVERLHFEQPLPRETRSFRFRLPQGPYSCSGQLVSVTWALELIAEYPRGVTRQELEIGPGRKAVRLQHVQTAKRTGLNLQFGS